MNTLLLVAVLLASFTKSTQGKGRIGNGNGFGIEPEPWVDKAVTNLLDFGKGRILQWLILACHSLALTPR